MTPFRRTAQRTGLVLPMLLLAIALPPALAACAGLPFGDDEPRTLRLATTTSTEDSGLLDAILPAFERERDAEVEVIAVGTGQALTLGERGDVDVVLVHARKREDEFVSQGFGVNRRDVMWNDFVIVGPVDDPAAIADAASAAEAFERVAAARLPFLSRGDESGTHIREQAIWQETGSVPESGAGWYQSLGQGMGETLVAANEQRAYTLADRATFLATSAELPDLTILFGGETIDANPDPGLRNPYGVIQVNPEKHSNVNDNLAAAFVEWITSPETQEAIAAFGREEFGQSIFQPGAP